MHILETHEGERRLTDDTREPRNYSPVITTNRLSKCFYMSTITIYLSICHVWKEQLISNIKLSSIRLVQRASAEEKIQKGERPAKTGFTHSYAFAL